MKKDEEGTLWMHTGDEGVMDEEGYVRSEYYYSSSAIYQWLFVDIDVFHQSLVVLKTS